MRAISALYLRALRRRWQQFAQAVEEPRAFQERRLAALIRANVETEFGRRHGFGEIDSVARFRRRVPVRDYEGFAPWIDRVAAGAPAVLTSAPVRVMERSSGSTSVNKLIPYTDALLDEFSAATGPWIHNLHCGRPALRGTLSYWSISPVTRQRQLTSGGIPIGFEDDTEYFGPLQRWALARLMAVPSTVARIPEIERWRDATCLHLLHAGDLGLISVWSPTFLCLLMEHMERHLERLIAQLPPARARAVCVGLARGGGRLTGAAIWPRLQLVSCWADGSSSAFLDELRRWFPGTPLQPKGLLATEGVVSFPLWGRPGAVLAVAGHFLEFVDVENPGAEPLLAHELREGACYSPLLTTGGGLYRYHLKDVVRCVGRYRGTPLIRFAGKLDAVSDICGEKLNARHVEAALARARRVGFTARFAMLAPSRGGSPPSYTLYFDGQMDRATVRRALGELERHLASIHHYRYCRQLGQLGPPRAVRVRDGWHRYQAALVAQGMRVGDIKPAALDLHGVAAQVFAQEPR